VNGAADGAGPTAIPERVALATHYYATGPAFDLETYLRSRTSHLLFIAHPLYAHGGSSYLRRYRDDRLVKVMEKGELKLFPRFISDVVRTVRWTQQAGYHDLFIAGDNLLAIAGLWLRRRRHVHRVVLYSIDYVPRRFGNAVLNRLYHRVDRLAAGRADIVWNLSPAIAEARRRRDGTVRSAPQIVVPMGANVGGIRQMSLSAAIPHRLAFLGHLLEKQGVQLAIEALPAIRQRVPDVSLLIIGDGPYRPALVQLAAQRGVSDIVEFTGYLEDHQEIERQLAACALSLAPYKPDPESFTRFADPGKVKTYLACGLPVILTDVPAIARQLERLGAGQVVPYDVAAMTEAITAYLTDRPRLERARAAATAYGSEYAWDRVFAEAFRASARYLA